MKNFFKITSVIVACFLAWLVTNSLLAQQRAKPMRPAPPAGKTTLKAMTAPRPAAQARAVVNAPSGMASLKTYRVTMDNHRATISADSVIVDRRPGISYIWRLKVVSVNKAYLVDTWYDHQVFKLDATGLMEPTFNEILDLPDGAKMVVLTLYEFPDGVDLPVLKQAIEKGSIGSVVFSGVKTISP